MTSNRIQNKLNETHNLLSIYFTAGYPSLNDTVPVLKALQESGVDMVEIGLPFSDPLADGPTIQQSSTEALQNGMTTKTLFQQLKDVRQHIDIPLIIMGYFNPMLQFGFEKFCAACNEVGIDGLIIPDLPLAEYTEHYQHLFEQYNLSNVFLITPQTSQSRIEQIDNASNSFIYMVSSASVTGSTSGFGDDQKQYFKRISDLKLNNPQIVGFGIKDNQTFKEATQHAKGAIIGSAFIKHLKTHGVNKVADFVSSIR